MQKISKENRFFYNKFSPKKRDYNLDARFLRLTSKYLMSRFQSENFDIFIRQMNEN